MFELWIIFTACLVAINCALLGSFLMLKKMSMIGDALSHAVLPGIVIAFLITNTHYSFWSILIASGIGLLAVFVMSLLSEKGGFQRDTAIGITYTLLFSIGIIMISAWARNADIDVDCVLFGDIGNVPFKTPKMIFGVAFPPDTLHLLGFTFANILIITIGIKGFSITTFDPLFATTLGIASMTWHYGLLSLTAINTVFSFDSVGAIMVISLLVIPPAFAHLFTRKIKPFLGVATSFGVVNCILGFQLSLLLNVNIVATINSLMGLLFIAGFLWQLYVKRRNTKHLDLSIGHE